MAKIPDATAFGTRPSIDPGGRRQIIAMPGGEGLAGPIRQAAAAQAGYAATAGQGLESLAGAAFKIAQANEHLLEVRRKVQVDSAVTRAAADLKVFTLDLKNDPNVETYGKQFEDRSKQIFDTYSKGLDQQGAAEFQARFEPLTLDQALTVRQLGNNKLIDQSVAGLDQNLEEMAQLASRSNSKAEYDKLVANGALSVDKMVKAGIISAEDGGKRIRAFQGRLDEVKVMQLISDNPGQATKILANPDMFTHIDPLRRESLSNSAFSRTLQMMSLSNSIADRNERLADKQLKRVSDATAKDGWDLWSKGQLTPDWLNANKSKLDQGDYTGLVKAQRGEDSGIDDPHTISDLTTRAATEDVTADANRALAAGLLKTGTYRSIISSNRTLLNDDRPASPYKSARERVRGSLDQGALLIGPAQLAGKIAQQNALTEFDAWAETNSQADRATYMQEAEAVIKRYQAIGFDQISLTQGLPRYYTGTRESLTPQALDQAARQAVSEHDAGRMSEAQLVEELQKIKNWRVILTMKAGPTTTPKNPPAFNPAKPGGK